MHGETMKEGQQ